MDATADAEPALGVAVAAVVAGEPLGAGAVVVAADGAAVCAAVAVGVATGVVAALRTSSTVTTAPMARTVRIPTTTATARPPEGASCVLSDTLTLDMPLTAMRVPEDVASGVCESLPDAMRAMRIARSRVSGGANGSRAAASSAMDRKRRSRSFSRQRATTAASVCGTSGRRSSIERGGSVRTIAVSCVTDSATNGTCPVRSS